MRIRLHLFFIFCFIWGFSITLLAKKKEQSFIDYINKYSDLAIQHKDKYKIPASITLAQGILESGAGSSELAKQSNNHFGIKCHSDWKGARVYYQDDIPNDCFRKYKSVEESYEDHSKFLVQWPRYAVLFKYNIRDYTAWAKGLQACGYATNKGYANKLIQIIEDYELYKYDVLTPVKKKTAKKNPVLLRDVYKTYNLIYVLAKADDSFDKIADETGFKVKDLIKYNEVPENFPLKEDDIVYLQMKKKKADIPYFFHIVKVGESMHSISQQYGIRLKNLYKINNKDPAYVPTEGEALQLR